MKLLFGLCCLAFVGASLAADCVGPTDVNPRVGSATTAVTFNAASGDLEQGFQVSCSGGLLEFAAELETDITNVGGDVHVEVSDSVNTFIGDVTATVDNNEIVRIPLTFNSAPFQLEVDDSIVYTVLLSTSDQNVELKFKRQDGSVGGFQPSLLLLLKVFTPFPDASCPSAPPGCQPDDADSDTIPDNVDPCPHDERIPVFWGSQCPCNFCRSDIDSDGENNDQTFQENDPNYEHMRVSVVDPTGLSNLGVTISHTQPREGVNNPELCAVYLPVTIDQRDTFVICADDPDDPNCQAQACVTPGCRIWNLVPTLPQGDNYLQYAPVVHNHMPGAPADYQQCVDSAAIAAFRAAQP